MDSFITLLLALTAIATLVGRVGTAGRFRSDDALGVTLVILQTLPLAARSIRPLLVLVVISCAVVAHSALGYAQVQAGTFTSLIALYGAASLTDGRTAALAAMISASSVAAFFATNRGDWTWSVIASTAATWSVAWIAGSFARVRGEQLELAGVRAAKLELERDANAREAVADERARMARELHDIVGHALNLIVIQASGADRVFESRPSTAREALTTIESAGRSALVDMERMLGVLRANDLTREVSGPQPGVEQLDELATRVSESGIPVRLVVEGEPVEMPASLELTAYRIVQESLTNSLKHSGASSIRVTVRYLPDALELEVDDDGKGTPVLTSPGSGGRGHVGMRERAALFGGSVSVGPSAEGYRVVAKLPYRGSPA